MANKRNQHLDGGQETKTVQRWPFAVCAVVIIGSLIGILGVLLNPRTSAVLQARLACIFVFFAIACVMGILFLRSTEKSEVGGKLGVWKVAIIGPGAFFLACLILYNQFFHEDVLQLSDPITMKAFSDLIRDTEKRSGWSGYDEWQRKIKGLAPEILQNEEQTIETYLSAVYFRGNDAHKLSHPFLQIAFIYGKPDEKGYIDTIKLERISGYWEQDTPRVYAPSKGTTLEGKVASKLFIKHLNGQVVKPTYVAQQGIYQPDPNWLDVSDCPADCLLVTKYREQIPGGDYVLIDPSKYIAAESDGARIEFAIISSLPISEPQLWEMRGAGAAFPGEVPLLFREFHSGSQPDSKILSNRIRTDEGFNGWLDWLDKEAELDVQNEQIDHAKSEGTLGIEHDLDTIKFLQGIREILRTGYQRQNATFRACLRDTLESTFSFRLYRMKDPVIATFLWTDKTTQKQEYDFKTSQLLGQGID